MLTLILGSSLLLSCTNQNQIRPGDSLEVAFDKAMAFYDRGRFGDAAQAFETVITVGRGTDIGQEAQFFLAESYFKNRQYRLAASEYQRYHIFFNRSDRSPDAQFMEAYSYYLLSPRYELDQTDTFQSIELFQLFVSRNRASPRVEEAVQYIDEMREKLAQKNFSAANQYMRLGRRTAVNFRAAAIYYGLTIDRYPETSFAEKSQANQIRAWVYFAENSTLNRQEERFNKAIESYETYVQLFPRGANRSLAEEYFDRAVQGRDQAVSQLANL
ncbi:Beta-barrel assembly machine subunit BamD [Cyclonatronum proteinivorum]|uniref:Beta-barrel assembly machine subunit BamD n=1 Tax=Cyclonatronum proteinivorum TaxID=1457365 RepID=A0A345UK55_9BACT|nr:outer membrane protein assembly factor BamD [Cyclonatronum proteinivorum]AXJ00857.1 Beta-barrel assembly machine subunit BamD [Cyclonatronum proteinivorum]